MALHISWDNQQKNGVVFNEKYPTGALFTGVELRPEMSFEYDNFMYTEQFEVENTKMVNGEVFGLTPEEVEEAKDVARNWVQPLGQEGNPTVAQAYTSKKLQLLQVFNLDVLKLDEAPTHEVSSWAVQEREARGYMADNCTETPMIDAMLAARAQDETKEDLVSVIISKADKYMAVYGEKLGRYHRALKSAARATTVADIQAVVY